MQALISNSWSKKSMKSEYGGASGQLSRGREYSDDTMNKQRCVIEWAWWTRLYWDINRRIEANVQLCSVCTRFEEAATRKAALLSLARRVSPRAFKRNETLQDPSPGCVMLESLKYSLEYSDTSDTCSNIGYLDR